MPVTRVDFEPTLRLRKPAIDYVAHGQSALAEPESERLLFAAIANVALHTNRHRPTIPLKPVQISCQLGASLRHATSKRARPGAEKASTTMLKASVAAMA
jgi:hypothetical protein